MNTYMECPRAKIKSSSACHHTRTRRVTASERQDLTPVASNRHELIGVSSEFGQNYRGPEHVYGVPIGPKSNRRRLATTHELDELRPQKDEIFISCVKST